MKVVTNLDKLSVPTTEVDYDGNMPKGYGKLIAYLKAHKDTAIGISANQLGIDMRVCAFWNGDIIRILVNPFITQVSKETTVALEGCMSIPKKQFPIERRNWVIVTSSNNIAPQTYSGWMARIVQHEIDHLDGFTVQDKRHTHDNIRVWDREESV